MTLKYDPKVYLFLVELTPLFKSQPIHLWNMCLAIPYPSAQAYNLQKKELQDPPSLQCVRLELQHRVNAAKLWTSLVYWASVKMIALPLGLGYLSVYLTHCTFPAMLFSLSYPVSKMHRVFRASQGTCNRLRQSSEPEWEGKSLKYSIHEKNSNFYKILVTQVFVLCAYSLNS